jgi:hypothetical protein
MTSQTASPAVNAELASAGNARSCAALHVHPGAEIVSDATVASAQKKPIGRCREVVRAGCGGR